MKEIETERRTRVLLSVQRALLGEVSPLLRHVAVEYDEKSVSVSAYFDGPIHDDDVDSMSCVETEMIADYPADHVVEITCVRYDAPGVIPAKGIPVYSRRERSES